MPGAFFFLDLELQAGNFRFWPRRQHNSAGRKVLAVLHGQHEDATTELEAVCCLLALLWAHAVVVSW